MRPHNASPVAAFQSQERDFCFEIADVLGVI
jgi:hypothetical protein